jgi:uncharacterized protein YkwD
MRRAALVAAAVLSGALAVPAAGAGRPKPCPNANRRATAADAAAMRAAVLCLVNRQRTARHLPALRADVRLQRSAQRWTNHMVAAEVFTHGSNFAGRITAAGYRWSAAGENIATGFSTPAAVVTAWMHSADHCRNILAPEFRDLGVGVVARPVRGFASGPATWTEDFGLHRGQPPASRNFAPANGCPY